MIGFQVIFTYVPFMNLAFHSHPITLTDWIIIVTAGILIFLMIEIEKAIQRKFAAKQVN